MKKFFNAIRNSLRLKYILASVLVELVVLALLIGNSLRIITTTIEQESTGRTESVTQLLDSALGYLLIERD